jgi:integrase
MSKIRGVYEKTAGSGIWSIQYFDSDGKRRRETVGSKSAAIDLYRKRKTEVMEGKKLPERIRAKAVTFGELGDAAIEYSKANKISWKDDEYRIAPLKKAFGNRPANSIKPEEIERWLSAQSFKPATRNRYRALISLVYRLGMANGKVSCNPARLVRQRRENNARIRFLDEKEEAKLREKIFARYPHHMPEFDLALNTGMRLGEQYGLTWDNVDLERRQLTIPRSKNGETRRVPLNDAAIAALRTAEKFANGQPYVFLNCYGQRLMSPREWFDPCIVDADLKDFTFHCLRHTFASRLVMKGVDLRTVQELMGHKTIQMTVRYAHLAPQHQLAAVQRLCDTDKALAKRSATRTATRRKSSSGSESRAIN